MRPPIVKHVEGLSCEGTKENLNWTAAAYLSSYLSRRACSSHLLISIPLWLRKAASDQAEADKKEEADAQAASVRAAEALKTREALEAVKRKVELLGRSKLLPWEEQLLAQEEARQGVRAEFQMATCPRCMMRIHRDAAICPYCRSSFEQIWRCPMCKMAVDQYAVICPHCRTGFE